MLGGNEYVGDKLSAKPEPSARNARESRAKPELAWGVWGGGSVSPSLIFFKIRPWNRANWCIVEAKI